MRRLDNYRYDPLSKGVLLRIGFNLPVAGNCLTHLAIRSKGDRRKAWRLLGWFHLHLVPVFLIAHVAGCRFNFWTYQSIYLAMIPGTIPLIGGIPLLEFAFYSVFTAAVIGLYFAVESLFPQDEASHRSLRITRIATLGLWGLTFFLIVSKPNPMRTGIPVWFFLMAGSSLPFSCAVLGIPPFGRLMPFVAQTCSKRSFIGFSLLLLPIMAFWELSAIRHGLWVYNQSMILSSLTTLSSDGTRLWPVDMLFGHTNTAIIVFLATFYRNLSDAGTAKV